MAPTLQELEKIGAPLMEQIQQASIFAGTSYGQTEATQLEKIPRQMRAHGRQEYILRWLLKKLQEDLARRCPASWRLLRILIDIVPLRNAVKILNEKKFVLILRQAVEEAVVASNLVDGSIDAVTVNFLKDRGRRSKKRKRDDKISGSIDMDQSAMEDDEALILAIYDAADRIVQLSKPEAPSNEILLSEYVKSAIRVSGGEAAKIAGSWLVLFTNPLRVSAVEQSRCLLSPFLELWDLRISGPEDARAFSEHCLNPCLMLLSASTGLPEWKYQLERLLARNILVPGRIAYGSSKDTSLLKSLVGDSMSTNPRFGPITFKVAIRCIRPHGSRPRSLHDTDWLQDVFRVLYLEMSGNLSQEKVNSIDQMLRYCIDYKATLELPFLQSITSQYGLTDKNTNWGLLATVVELDSNTFLIPSASGDLLKDALMRITKAGIDATWPIIADQVIDDVLVPLMGEFAKARQLRAFIHHWYEQLAEIDKFRQGAHKHIDNLTAWEDESLRSRLRDLLEPSLTIPQIVEIVDWLEEKIDDCEGAVCILLDVIASAMSSEDTVIALRLKLHKLAKNLLAHDILYKGHKARLLHLNTVMLHWSSLLEFEDTLVMGGDLTLTVSLHSPDRLLNVDHSLEAIETFRYLCAGWSIGAAGFRSDVGVKTLSQYLINVALHIKKVINQIAQGLPLGEEKWGNRITATRRSTGWLACAYSSCVLVEYPRVLELCIEGQILTDFIWIASATTPSSSLHSSNPWLRINCHAFPSMWMQMLQNEHVQNTPSISQKKADVSLAEEIIGRMLECGTHIGNPIEKSRACNGFIIRCLHQLPLEIFSRSNRESILKSWPSDPPDHHPDDPTSLSYKINTLDPAIVSLKVKVSQHPTIYEGIEFQELVNLAERIVTFCQEPEVLLPIFAELPRLILSHVFATIDQPKSLNYVKGVNNALRNWFQVNTNAKSELSYAMIRLAQVVLTEWRAKCTSSDVFSSAYRTTSEELTATFRGLLLSNLKRRLQKPEKLKNDHDGRCMSVYSTMDALDAIDVSNDDLVNLQIDARVALVSLNRWNSKLGQRFEVFKIEHRWTNLDETPMISFGDVTSVTGRHAIQRKAMAATKQMAEPEKLQLATSLIGEQSGEQALDKLLALGYIIASCEDSGSVATQESSDITPSLSSIYSTLNIRLRGVNGVRQFCLISETMDMILCNKVRVITQYNIDSTLASITTLCSSQAPALSPSRAGTIYHHLVRLVNRVLTSHRLRLQGRFHLVIQTLKSLLSCLFIPSSTSNPKSIQGHAFPPWLSSLSSDHALTHIHATAYTRLLTLICDPSVSAVSRFSNSSLNSATKIAKALAGLHMPFVLIAYIRSQLDMSLSMEVGIRDALTPGWYAVFDTMTLDARRALGESLDASGRAVLAGLVKDWLKFGKWKGN